MLETIQVKRCDLCGKWLVPPQHAFVRIPVLIFKYKGNDFLLCDKCFKAMIKIKKFDNKVNIDTIN